MTLSAKSVKAMATLELSDPIYTAIEEHLYSELGDEAVILNLANGKYYGINPVGVTIWKTIRTPASLSDIEEAIIREFEVDLETCREEALRFLEKMVEEQLVKVNG